MKGTFDHPIRAFSGGKIFPEDIVAYCPFHHCGITAKTMKSRGCLSKNCNALVRNEKHGYWEARSAAKDARARRKENLEALYRASIKRELVNE